MKKGVMTVLLVSLILVLSVSFVSANFFSDFFDKLFGQPSFSPEEGLVLYMPFDSDAKDYSGNNNNAIETSALTSVQGKRGNAYSFNGANSYIKIADSSTLDVETDRLTLSAWVYPTTYRDFDRIIAKPWASATTPWNVYVLNFNNDASAKAGFNIA